jgi:hypothetical protein
VVEAGIHEAALVARRRFAATSGVVEEVATVLSGAEHEGRGEEHWRLDRTLR